MSNATLIVEAGLPSGTFSTAKFALEAGRDVWAVPGSVVFPGSAGCNKLIYDGATPIINDDIFRDQLMQSFNCKLLEVLQQDYNANNEIFKNPLLHALVAHPMKIEELYEIVIENFPNENPATKLSRLLMEAENSGLVCKYSNGMYGPKNNKFT